MRRTLFAIGLVLSVSPVWGEATPAGLQSALADMRAAREAVNTTQGHAQAESWYQLQKATEEFGNVYTELYMNCVVADANRPISDCPERNALAQAKSIGVYLTYCQTEDRFITDMRGYKKYLKLWPRGPHADEAWWESRLAPPCCTKECAAQDIPWLTAQLDLIKRFIQIYPKSRRMPEAREKLAEYQEKLKEARKAESPKWGVATLQDPNRCSPLPETAVNLTLDSGWTCHFGLVSQKNHQWTRALTCKMEHQSVQAQWLCPEYKISRQQFQDLGAGKAILLFCTCVPSDAAPN